MKEPRMRTLTYYFDENPKLCFSHSTQYDYEVLESEILEQVTTLVYNEFFNMIIRHKNNAKKAIEKMIDELNLLDCFFEYYEAELLIEYKDKAQREFEESRWTE